MSIGDKLLKSAAAGGLTPSENFNIVLYTGNSSDQSITGVGFQPDFVWLKERDDGAENHNQIDSTRGTGKILSSNLSNAEFASGRFTSFDTDGFTLSNNNESNDSGVKYVAWCWKSGGGTTASNGEGSITSTVQANDDAGFSIVKYTGTGSNLTIGHGLSAAPDVVIVKNLDSTGAWLVQHISIGPTKAFYLETNNSATDNATFWNDTAPTATTVSIGTHSDGNASGDDAIAYCFRNVAGFSKFGSYTGDRTNDVIVETGFEVGYVLIKAADATDDWFIISQETGNTVLYANSSNAEAAFTGVSFLSNGFMLNGSANSGGTNNAGTTFIYMAFATDPDTEQPTLADSFGIKAYTGNGSSQSLTGLGFQPNLIWIKQRGGTNPHGLWDSIRGAGKLLVSNTTAAESGNAGDLMGSFDADGFQVNRNYDVHTAYDNTNYGVGGGASYIAWAWKSNDDVPTFNDNGSIDSIVSVNDNAGFSIVKWNGTGSNGTVGHGLSATPEIIISKNLTSAATDGWPVYSQTIGNDYTFFLNSSGAKASTGGTWGSTSPTSTVFTVQDNDSNNEDGDEIIAYCFHSVAGYSKISSYSGTGSSNAITGMGFQPDYVMIKEADGIDSWEVYDSVRGADKVLYPNGSNAEGTGSNFTSFDSGGFTVSSATSVNESGKTYIYIAFKIN